MRDCRTLFPLILAGLLLSTVAACGGGVDYGPTGTIQGTLTMDGQPLPAGTQVVFMHPEKGYAAFGGTDAQGHYEITSWNDGQMPVGTYHVMIQPAAGANSDEEPSPEDLLDNPEKFEQAAQANFPFKYRQTNSSGLEFPVTEGANTIDIEIKSR